jgi:hypothetical protein
MLFTMELFKMYSNFALSRGWPFDVITSDVSDVSGSCLLECWLLWFMLYDLYGTPGGVCSSY